MLGKNEKGRVIVDMSAILILHEKRVVPDPHLKHVEEALASLCNELNVKHEENMLKGLSI
jgi:hypothetical protein